MEHWLSSNMELVIGSAVGVVGIVVALLIYFWEREPKRLDYEVVSSVPIMSEVGTATFGSKLQVTYDDEQIDHPHIVVVRVKNTGKVAVARDDYVEPISFDLDKFAPAIALDGFVTKESTPRIVKELFEDFGGLHGGDVPAIAPDLLNRGEWFEVQYFCENAPEDIALTARFRDQSRPMRDMGGAKRSPMPREFMALGLLMASMVGVLVAIQALNFTVSMLISVFAGGLVGIAGRRLQ